MSTSIKMDKLNSMEEKLANMSPEQLSQNAQHIWQMLDDMAENNPQMYRKFIDKQMAESKKYNEKPNPHMCVQTKMTTPDDICLFINVFEWTRVPGPKSDDDPIPVIGGVFYNGRDDSGIYKIITVAFNPKVLEEFGIESHLYQERRMLINLAIDFLQDQHKCTISRNYTILKKTKPYKGTLIKAVETVSRRARKQDEAVGKEVDELEKTFGSLAASDKDSLLSQLSNLSVSEQDDDSQYVEDDPVPLAVANSEEEKDHQPTSNSSNIDVTGSPPDINLPTHHNVKANVDKDIKLPGSVPLNHKSGANLIQEVGMPEGQKTLIKPEFTVGTKHICENEKNYLVKIQLPGVNSVAECELDISKKDLHLLVENHFELNLPFEERIDEDKAKAKFSKKSSTLTLTLPIL